MWGVMLKINKEEARTKCSVKKQGSWNAAFYHAESLLQRRGMHADTQQTQAQRRDADAETQPQRRRRRERTQNAGLTYINT